MGRTFKFRIKGDKKAILAEVRRRAAEQGVTFEGDESGGQFSGLISAYYEVSGDLVTLTIERKPWFVSWETIESQIQQLFC
jgi:hypothetical protein